MLKALITKRVAGAVTRHVMGLAGGWLVSNGIADASQIEAITGGAAAVVAVGWSLWAKRLEIAAEVRF